MQRSDTRTFAIKIKELQGGGFITYTPDGVHEDRAFSTFSEVWDHCTRVARDAFCDDDIAQRFAPNSAIEQQQPERQRVGLGRQLLAAVSG